MKTNYSKYDRDKLSKDLNLLEQIAIEQLELSQLTHKNLFQKKKDPSVLKGYRIA